MKLRKPFAIILSSIVVAGPIAQARPPEPYNKDTAVNYARTWVSNTQTLRNSNFPDLSANSSDGG